MGVKCKDCINNRGDHCSSDLWSVEVCDWLEDEGEYQEHLEMNRFCSDFSEIQEQEASR